jgi:hypothetical protein
MTRYDDVGLIYCVSNNVMDRLDFKKKLQMCYENSEIGFTGRNT